MNKRIDKAVDNNKRLLFILADFGFYFSTVDGGINCAKVKLAPLKNYSITSELLKETFSNSSYLIVVIILVTC